MMKITMLTRVHKTCLAWLTLSLASGLYADDRYHVTFAESLDQVTVNACFDGSPPSQLFRGDKAGQHVLWIRSAQGDDLDIKSRYGTLRLPDLPDNACIGWRVDLKSAVSAGDYRLAYRSGNSLLTNADLWFWRDGDKRPITVVADLPPGMNISTPWTQLTADSVVPAKFRPDSTPASWSARIAIGKFPIQTLGPANESGVVTGDEANGPTVAMAAIGDLSPRQRQKFTTWMQQTASSLGSVYGRFPRDRVQVLIVPIGQHARGQAVPWAHVLRGGGVGIEFFVDETRPLKDFVDDWTATHEFSHLLLPYISGSDRWLSEGLASYYQNILRARDGRLSEEEAWQKLHLGFERGRTGDYRGTLASAGNSGRNATMRVYWSGAAMMLKADAELRRRTGGRQSLDSALAKLQVYCSENDSWSKKWRARELFSQLDQLTGTTVFQDLYDEHVYDREFPDVSKTFAQLGVITESRNVRLEPDAPWARIRYYIMNG